MVGVNLQLNWEYFENIFRTSKELTTNKHKTEKFYTVHVRILEDHRKFSGKRRRFWQTFTFTCFLRFSTKLKRAPVVVSRKFSMRPSEIIQQKIGSKQTLFQNFRYTCRQWSRARSMKGWQKLTWPRRPHSEKLAQGWYISKNTILEDGIEVVIIYADEFFCRTEQEDYLTIAARPPKTKMSNLTSMTEKSLMNLLFQRHLFIRRST